MSAKIKTHPHPHASRHRHKPRKVSIRAFERAYWPYLPLLVVIALMFSLVVRGQGLSSLSHPGEKVLSYASSMNISKLLENTNSQRVKEGLPKLTLNTSLDSAASVKARNMAQLDYWSHNTPSGQPPWVFVASQNYNYQQLGENLAAGFVNESSVVNAWMASPGHRENILNPAYTEVGFGVSQSPDYKSAGGGPMTIVVAYYARPASAVQLAVSHNVSPLSNSAVETSHAQLAIAGVSWAGAGTILAAVVIAGALGIMIGRHLIAFRRAVRNGERFVAKHPLVDVCFLVIVFLAFIMTQTAGFIR